MSGTFTSTRTFTISHARYITSKIAADLRQLRLFYGSPADADIDDYGEEAALLLRDGYLERVDYGFKKEDSLMGPQWVLLLRYTARDGVLEDDHAGRVPPAVNVAGARFWSFLSYSARFFALSEAERERVKAALPIQRSAGREAGFVTGTWTGARTYSASDQGVARSVFRAL